MQNKNIVRYMTVGKPVVIGQRSKPATEEAELEEVAEQPERKLPPEVLDKIFAEIEEIQQKEQVIEQTLSDAQQTRDEAEQLKRDAEQLKQESEQLKQEAEQVKQQAQTVLTQAQADADKIVADTKKDAEELLARVRKEGFDAGHKEGKEQGIKDGKEKITDELADIVRQANAKAQKTITDAKEQTAEYFIRAEDEIVAVVMMAIEKILPQHFLDVPQVVLPVVRESIKYVRDQREVKIHVDPDSYDLILMARAEFQSMLTDGTAVIEVISDEALKPGDCVIETPNGGVDSRLSTRLDLMKKAVETVLNK